MKRLLLIPFMVLLTIPSTAQDSTAVAFDSWDIAYHVFSGKDYLRVMDSPYKEARAIFVYQTHYLQSVHVFDSGCANYLPSRRGTDAVLKRSSTSCSMYRFYMDQITAYIDGKPERKKGPVSLDEW